MCLFLMLGVPLKQSSYGLKPYLDIVFSQNIFVRGTMGEKHVVLYQNLDGGPRGRAVKSTVS